jgi:small-conductance mechanosensitive channel
VVVEGDWVIIHGSKRIEGVVEEVSLRVTRVRSFDGHTMYVKNRDISAAVVENVFDRTTSKVSMELLVSPTADPAKVYLAISALQKQIPTLPGCQVAEHSLPPPCLVQQ